MAISKLAYGRGTGKLHPIDVHVGIRVRQRRTLLGMTQTDLANVLNEHVSAGENADRCGADASQATARSAGRRG